MITPPKRRWHKVHTLDDQGQIPLTPEAHARMKARLTKLKAQLPELAAEAGETAALGDRSDNAAYKEAKSLLRRAQRQIFTLEDQLKRVIEIRKSARSGRVELGSIVTLESYGSGADDGGGAKKAVVFRIVGPFETDPAAGRISHKSPLGAALIGCAEGDIVHVHTAHGEIRYRVIRIH